MYSGKLLCSSCLPHKVDNERVCKDCIVFTDRIVHSLTEGFEMRKKKSTLFRTFIFFFLIGSKFLYMSDLMWFRNDKNIWEPVQPLTGENENENESGIENEGKEINSGSGDNVKVGRCINSNYRTFTSGLHSKPEMIGQSQLEKTINGVVKGYVELCKQTEMHQEQKVIYIGYQDTASDAKITRILCKDGKVKGVELDLGQRRATFPITKFETKQLIVDKDLRNDEHCVKIVDTYRKLEKERNN
ncbi:hypothetical protein RFI_10800, partial [Reticulomyxa filosa]